MPQITKCRIVNFFYNDGKRLIADELFDFGNKQSIDAINTLIDMDNGVGKTVLVQLMMQPVVPRVVVSERNIENYFTKPTDHNFVLLEWKKDNSDEKLLTGIAMASSDSSKMDDDSRGRRIKYYTFYSNYSSYSKYDIASLELSRKENGRFIAESFEYVREISKKNKNELAYYSSDEGKEWGNKLEEYGIIQNEWRSIIAKLNCTEGGMSDYFKCFKRSNDIIDNLFIPTIEGQSGARTKGENNDLGVMMSDYANNYKNQKRNIAEMNANQELKQELVNVEQASEEVWVAKDEYEKALINANSMYMNLNKKNNELNEEKENLSGKIEENNKKINEIRWEKESLNYYETKEKYDKYVKEKESNEKTLSENKDKLSMTKKAYEIQKCAEIYSKITESKIQIKGLANQINKVAGESEESKRVNILGHSIKVILAKDLPIKEKIFAEKQKEIRNLEKQKDDLVNKKEKDTQENFRNEKEKNIKQGTLSNQKCSTDKLIEKLSINAMRSLIGGYCEEDITKSEKDKRKEQDSNTSKLEGINKELNNIENRLNEIPKLTEIEKDKKRELVNDKEGNEKEVENFSIREKEIKNYYMQYGYEYSDNVRDEGIRNFIQTEINNQTKKLNECEISIHQLDLQIAAIEKGNLHVSDDVVNYLDRIGVTYQTFEGYILNQVRNNNVTKEKCQTVLEINPILAYAIIMEDNQWKFINKYDSEWLSSTVPVFNNKQITAFLDEEQYNDKYLSLYAKEYFEDADDFLGKKEKEKIEISNQIELFKNNINQHNEAKKFIDDFFNDYCVNWKKNKLEEISKLNDKIKSIDDKISSYENDKNKLNEQKKKLSEDKDECAKNIGDINRWLEDYQELLAYIQSEKDYVDAIDKLSDKISILNREIDNNISIINGIDEKIKTNDDEISLLNKDIKEMNEIFLEVQDVEEKEVIEKDWYELRIEYQNLKANLGKDVEILQVKLEDFQEKVNRYEKELKEYSVVLDEYKNATYSEKEEDRLKNEITRLDKYVSALNNELRNLEKNVSEFDVKLENHKDKLKEFSGSGEPLPKEVIKSNFDNRINKLKNNLIIGRDKVRNLDNDIKKVERLYDLVKSFLEDYEIPTGRNDNFILEEDYYIQWNVVKKSLKEKSGNYKKKENNLKKQIDELTDKYLNSEYINANNCILPIAKLLNNEVKGDKYFTLMEHIESIIHSTGLRIGQLKTDLEDFESSKKNLVKQCTIQGKRIYEGLVNLQKSSNVNIFEGKPKKQIVKFGIPKNVDEDIAYCNIESEIDKGVIDIVKALEDDTSNTVKVARMANKLVESGNLLRRYIGQDDIKVEAFKIDNIEENSGYRSWESTQVDNSGAEKFVIYFTIIVSLITYNRSESYSIMDKNMTSVLVLDNPFGPITSPHVLAPMFMIAKQFQTQLICFSNITKCDITSKFDNVIKVRIKRKALSNIEMLSHEGNELIEHGFYRSEQTKMEFI